MVRPPVVEPRAAEDDQRVCAGATERVNETSLPPGAGGVASTTGPDALGPDDLRAVVEPLLPSEAEKPKGGRLRVPDRAALAGMILVLRTGMPTGAEKGTYDMTVSTVELSLKNTTRRYGAITRKVSGVVVEPMSS